MNFNDESGMLPSSISQSGHVKNETVLHKAVKTKDVEKVQKVLHSGGYIFVNSLDEESKTPLQIAIEEKLDVIVEMFLSSGKDIISDNQNLIHYAVSKGNIKIVKLLAEQFFVKAKKEENMKAFCTAVNEEKFEMLNYLLSFFSNSDTNLSTYNPCALLYLAIVAGNLEIVKKFLESEFVEINNSFDKSDDDWYTSYDYNDFSPLHLAVKYLKIDLVKLLLNAGADRSKENEAKSTALSIAFKAKIEGKWKTWDDIVINDKIIDTLLDVNLLNIAKLTHRDRNLHLYAACSRDKPEVIGKLFKKNSIPVEYFGINDHQGFSCLHFAAKYRCVKVAECLLRLGVNVNKKDFQLCTPLHVAAKETSLELVQLLMQHGADITSKDCYENTPVHLAFKDRNYAVLDILLTSHVITNSNPIDAVGISHFHIACTRTDVSLVKKFLDAGVSVNLKVPSISIMRLNDFNYNKDFNWHSCVPLHFAVAFNRPTVVELLLTNGANVYGNVAKGFQPIHVACHHNYDKYGDLFMESLQKWKNDTNVESLEWMAVQLKNRPYTDVTVVDEEIKGSSFNRHSQKFSNIFSQIRLRSSETSIIDWESNRRNQIDIIKLLVKNGANLNVLDYFGNSPIYYIYQFNVYNILDAMNYKLRLDEKLEDLIIKEFLKEMYCRRTILLDEIFKFGIWINLDKCYNNISILHYICQKNDFWDMEKAEMVKYFLDKNANPDAIDNSKRTPLHVLTGELGFDKLIDVNENDNLEFINQNKITKHKLCNSCRDKTQFICAQDNAIRQKTALQLSLQTLEHEIILETLLDYNAHVDFRDNKGQTPLFLACQTNKFLFVDILLCNGADVNIVDNEGQTAPYYFYKEHVKKVKHTMMINVCKVAKTLVDHVQLFQEIGLYICEKVENPILQINRCLTRLDYRDEFRYRECYRNQVEQMKNLKINDIFTGYYILFMDEKSVCKDFIIEKLARVSNEQRKCMSTGPNIFSLLIHKYEIAVKRKRLLSEAKETLNRLLSMNFPEICSDMIFAELRNFELAYFVKAFVAFL